MTFALVWTAATQHVANPDISGEGLEASAQGLLQVCFMGLGPMFGLFVGGYLFQRLGSHAVYGVFAIIVLGVGAVYTIWGGDDASSFCTQDSKPANSGSLAIPKQDAIRSALFD